MEHLLLNVSDITFCFCDWNETQTSALFIAVLWLMFSVQSEILACLWALSSKKL